MYNSRTPSPLEYQFPNNVNSNTFYGQASLSKINIRPPTGKLILMELYPFPLLYYTSDTN